MEQDEHEEGVRHRFASEHDERQGQSLEGTAQKKKGEARASSAFSESSHSKPSSPCLP